MKYGPLERYLRAQKLDIVAMSFKDVEKLIHASLPPSARRHRAWWSNNPSNSVATFAWLNAGYRSAKVDMSGERLVFERTAPVAAASLAEPAAPAYRAAPSGSLYARFRGVFKFPAGTDLTAPAGENWAVADE